jgi:hypothetical protein
MRNNAGLAIFMPAVRNIRIVCSSDSSEVVKPLGKIYRGKPLLLVSNCSIKRVPCQTITRKDSSAMTHREKILCALAHKEPDRVPVDLGGTESSGITGIAYHRLKTHLGIRDGKIRIFDLMQQIAKVEPSVLRRIGADAVPLLIEPKERKPSTLPDGIPCEIPRKIIIETRSNGDMVVLSKNNTP